MIFFLLQSAKHTHTHTKKDILKNVGGNQTVSVPYIDFCCMGKKYNGSQWEPKLVGYRKSFFCFTEE